MPIASGSHQEWPAQESLRFPLLSVLMAAHKEGRKWRFEDSWRGVFIWWIGKQPKKLRPLCGAKTRAGGTCKARCVDGKAKCQMHGGLSTGPKTDAGRAAIVASNKRRKKAG